MFNDQIKKFSKIIDKPVCNKIDFEYLVYKYDDLKKDFVTVKIKIEFNKESGFGFRVFEEYRYYIKHDKEHFKFEDAFEDFVERCSKFSDKYME